MEENNSAVDQQEMEKSFPSRVKEIRSILKDKYNIIIPKECDEFLIRCLRLKDGNLEKAIKLIKAFHTATADFHNWDAAIQPSLYGDLYQSGAMIPLKTRDSQGRRIFVIRTELWDTSRRNFDEVMAGLWMMAQYANAEFADVQTNGFVTVWDFKNFSLQHGWAVKHWRLLSLAKWVQNGVAGRIKAFHAINHPKIVSILYGGIKPFLKEKLRNRVLFHDNMNNFFKHIEPNCLPTIVGGTLDLEKCVDKPVIKGILLSDQFFQEMLEKRLPTK